MWQVLIIIIIGIVTVVIIIIIPIHRWGNSSRSGWVKEDTQLISAVLGDELMSDSKTYALAHRA